MDKRVFFEHRLTPYLLVAAQLAITLIFFIWPAAEAFYQSTISQDAFGLSTTFVGFANFERLFGDSLYLHSIEITLLFSAMVTSSSLSIALLLAAMADRVIRGSTIYRTLLIWPYALAPAVSGVLWLLLFNPTIGVFSYALHKVGYNWNNFLSGTDATILIVAAAAWKQVSYNFLFFVAGLQSIPRSLIEAAAIDGASPFKRFWNIAFPLLSPTTFFLVVVNLVYAFFDTFGLVDTTTEGGPAHATEILVYKVYRDGFVGLDVGGSAAQSVVLMGIVVLLTAIQFRYVERKVVY
jgi:sn-glycerol 3-phosphate transport system permease protein